MRPRSELAVTLEQLTSMGNDARTDNVAPAGPLCVLIACGGSNAATAAPTSFPSNFLSAGYRCVIAPIVTVYTEPAFTFIEQVYVGLGRGLTVAHAMVEARMKLLNDYGCPIGLTFMTHGDSRLSLGAARRVGCRGRDRRLRAAPGIRGSVRRTNRGGRVASRLPAVEVEGRDGKRCRMHWPRPRAKGSWREPAGATWTGNIEAAPEKPSRASLRPSTLTKRSYISTSQPGEWADG
jgi:CHAT domain